MVDIHRLISDLQTGTAHAEVHRIHVDVVRDRLGFRRLAGVGVFVLEERHFDLDLFLSALSN